MSGDRHIVEKQSAKGTVGQVEILKDLQLFIGKRLFLAFELFADINVNTSPRSKFQCHNPLLSILAKLWEPETSVVLSHTV